MRVTNAADAGSDIRVVFRTVRFRIPQPWSGPIGYSSSELFVEIGSRGRRRVHSTPRARDHGRHATGVCARHRPISHIITARMRAHTLNFSLGTPLVL